MSEEMKREDVEIRPTLKKCLSNNRILFGKYKDLTYRELYDNHKSYCQYILSNLKEENNKELFEYLKPKIDVNETYLTFGKYKHFSISEIKKIDEKYIQYLKTNDYIKHNCPNLYSRLQTI